MSDSPSTLKLFSLGIAAENLVRGQKTLMVTPIEHLMMLDGAVKSNPTADQVSGVDPFGNTVTSTVMTDNALEASWFPYHTNRTTPPDIRRGERILIYRYADRDEFLWHELGLDQNLRNLETISWAINATPAVGGGAPSPDISYFLEWSAHNKALTYRSSKANGEKVIHTFQFDHGNGTITLMDDLGQSLLVDGPNHRYQFTNADGTTIFADKQNLSLTAKDTINLNAAKTLNINTKTLAVTATTVTLSAETFTGNVTGNVTVDSPSIKLGGVTISNDQVSCGPITAALITCAGVNSSADVNAPNIG